jgi:hypothetical protein
MSEANLFGSLRFAIVIDRAPGELIDAYLPSL